jgi:serine/threonine-protein kinase HipA
MTTSNSLYVYLQRPDTGEWVTVGRYSLRDEHTGAFVGNDDDHPRNHAAVYHQAEKRWRLSPAFDVVPNPDEQPRTLSMQLSQGRFDIAREAVLANAAYFGFEDQSAATAHFESVMQRIADTFSMTREALPRELRALLQERLSHGLQAMKA